MFSTARCSLSGAGCTTLHRDQRLADRLRARRLVPAAGCAALLRNKFSKLARLLNETIVRNLFPSLSTAARKRWCTSTTLRFLLDGSFCLISHDFNRACSCLRASLEVSSSKTRKASRTRHIGSVLRSVSGSCSTQCQRSAKVSKGAGGQVVQRCHRQSLENQAVQHCWLIHVQHHLVPMRAVQHRCRGRTVLTVTSAAVRMVRRLGQRFAMGCAGATEAAVR